MPDSSSLFSHIIYHPFFSSSFSFPLVFTFFLFFRPFLLIFSPRTVLSFSQSPPWNREQDRGYIYGIRVAPRHSPQNLTFLTLSSLIQLFQVTHAFECVIHVRGMLERESSRRRGRTNRRRRRRKRKKKKEKDGEKEKKRNDK